MPKVSVIIPAYNSATVIGPTLASVAAQTMTDFEVLVVDDGSKDDLAAVMPADSRFRLIRHEKNQGATAARNTGVSAAQGHYIAFLDSDDLWMPEKLEKQLAALEALPDPDNAICLTRTRVDFGNGASILRPDRPMQPGERPDEYIYVANGFAQTSSFLLSRALASKVPYRPVLHEDHLYFIEICQLGATYCFVDEVLTVYVDVQRQDRLSNDMSLDRGNAYLRETQHVLSDRARLAYEARRLGHIILTQRPLAGIGLMVRAVSAGALRPRFAATMVLRAMIPAERYQQVRRRWVGKAQPS